MIMDGKELARYVNVFTNSIHDGIFPKYFPEYDNRVMGVSNDYFDGVKPENIIDVPHRLDSLDNQYILAKFRNFMCGPRICREVGTTFPANMLYIKDAPVYVIDNSKAEEFYVGSGTEEDMFQQSLVLDKWEYFTYEYLTEMNRLQAKDVQIFTERFFGFIMVNCDTLELIMMDEYGQA